MKLHTILHLRDEAETAIAEHRFVDAADLTDSIFLPYDPASPLLAQREHVRQLYAEAVQSLLEHTDSDTAIARQQEAYQLLIDYLQAALTQSFIENAPSFATRRIAETPADAPAPSALLDSLLLCPPGSDQAATLRAELFDTLWTYQGGTENPQALAEQLSLLPMPDLCAQTGALTLSLLRHFHIDKVETLLHLAAWSDHTMQHNDSPTAMQLTLQARIAVALALAFKRYHHFIAYYPETETRIEAFFQSPSMQPHLPQLLLSICAQGYAPKTLEHIVETMPSSIRELRQAAEEASSDTGDEPHVVVSAMPQVLVNKIMSRLGKGATMQDSMMAMSLFSLRRQQCIEASLDVHFAQYPDSRGKVTGFSSHEDYFRLFDPDAADMREAFTYGDDQDDIVGRHMLYTSQMGDTDSRIFAHMLGEMHRSSQTSLTEQMEQQFAAQHGDLDDEEMQEQIEAAQQALHHVHYEQEPYRSFCQSLFRFFQHPDADHDSTRHFHPAAVLATDLPLFARLYTSPAQVEPTLHMQQLIGADKQVLELTTFCLQHIGSTTAIMQARSNAFLNMGQWEEAIQALQHLHLLTDEPGLLLTMATLFSRQQRWADALSLYDRYAQADGERTADFVMQRSICLMQQRRWDDAVQGFYELELGGNNDTTVARGIAWCALHQGKLERAHTYYERLLARRHPSWEDHMNMGHTLWLQGQAAQALASYKHFARLFARAGKARRAGFAHWQDAYEADVASLLHEHKQPAEIALMRDAIRFAIEEANRQNDPGRF